MKKLHLTSTYFVAAVIALSTLVSSCSRTENSPGLEYMPDMYRSPAVEAYVDYDVDGDPVGDEYPSRNDVMSARQPVNGTIPFNSDASKAMYNYPYPFSKVEYEEAGKYFTKNPVELSPEVFAKGQEIYTKMCQHCHGEAGAGDGPIPTNGKYPPIPAYSGINGLTIGKMFHTITYGKGNMGSHASQLNKEERWIVIHYVTSLQKEMSYDDYAATMGSAPAPVDTMAMPMDTTAAVTPMDHGNDHDGHDTK